MMITRSIRFLIQDSLLTPFSQETLHPFNPGWGSSTLPIPLELVYVLTKHISCPQGRYKVIKLGLVLPLPGLVVAILNWVAVGQPACIAFFAFQGSHSHLQKVTMNYDS